MRSGYDWVYILPLFLATHIHAHDGYKSPRAAALSSNPNIITTAAPGTALCTEMMSVGIAGTLWGKGRLCTYI